MPDQQDKAAVSTVAWMVNNTITVATILGLIFSAGAAYYELTDHERRISSLEKSGQEVHEIHEYLMGVRTTTRP